MNWDTQTFKITSAGSLVKAFLIAGIIGLAVSAYGFTVDSGQFFHSYLTALVYWITIGLGALFFTLIHFLSNAKWSVVIRRWSESVMSALPVMGILFIPILFGLHDLFHWSHEDVVATDHLLQGKSGYLNTNFFIIRTIGYFVIWGLITWFISSSSLKLDKGYDNSLMDKIRRVSAGGMVLFALTISFASFDWLMSLNPHWYSTIFGPYIFAGSFVSFLSLTVIVLRFLQSKGILVGVVSVEHFHDLGKFMFTFIIFWAYMAFSQYFLIWYGGIPEETVWFLKRWEGSWREFSMLLMFGHFPIPFMMIIIQNAKRSKIMLPLAAVWIMFIHWVDIYWLVFPTFTPEGVSLSWMDMTTFVGVGGIFLWFVSNKFTSNPIIPVKDPHLGTSVRHVS